MDMVPIDRTCVNDHLMRSRRFPNQLPASGPNIPAKHRIAILRHPNQVVLAVPHRMAATLVRFHPLILHANAATPPRLNPLHSPFPPRAPQTSQKPASSTSPP